MIVHAGRRRFVNKVIFSHALKRLGNANPMFVTSKNVGKGYKSRFRELSVIRLRYKKNCLITAERRFRKHVSSSRRRKFGEKSRTRMNGKRKNLDMTRE